MSTADDRKRRDAAFRRQGGKCYYCNCQMVKGGQKSSGGLRADACTLEHLDDRFSEFRGMLRGERRVVAACYACNNKRAHERNRQHQELVRIQTQTAFGQPA